MHNGVVHQNNNCNKKSQQYNNLRLFQHTPGTYPRPPTKFMKEFLSFGGLGIHGVRSRGVLRFSQKQQRQEFIPTFGGFYFIYLTNWTLLLETMTLVMLFASTFWGYLTPPDEQKSAPLFVKYTMSFWYIIQPMSLIVTILYWTTVNEFWDPYPIVFASYWAHLLNWMVLIVLLLVSRLPFSLKNGIWPLIYTFIYMLWTIIHYFLEIGRGVPCDDYFSDNECPIYNAFDWNEPALALVYLAGAFVALVVVLLYYVGLVRCRDRFGSRTAARQTATDVEKADGGE